MRAKLNLSRPEATQEVIGHLHNQFAENNLSQSNYDEDIMLQVELLVEETDELHFFNLEDVLDCASRNRKTRPIYCICCEDDDE